MALEWFVEDGDHTRFSVQAFINGCLPDSQSDGYDSLAAACEYARELAETYFGGADSGAPGGTKASMDVAVVDAEGTVYITRWLVYRVDEEGDEVGAQYLVTVEAYEYGVRCAECGEWIPDEESRLMTHQTTGYVQDDLSICEMCRGELELEDYIELKSDGVYTVLPDDKPAYVPSWTRNVTELVLVTGEQAAARKSFEEHMDYLDRVYGRDTRLYPQEQAS